MRHNIIFWRYMLLVCVASWLEGCSRRSDNAYVNNQDSLVQSTKFSDQNLSGTFEYSEPIEESYLYLKIEMGQNADSLDGQLWAGIYLAKSDAGEFTSPTVLVACSLKGVKKDDAMEMQLVVTKTDRLEEDAPDLLGMMNFPDLDTKVIATIWAFSYENGALVSQNGLLMPDGKNPVKFIWKKIK